MTIAIICLWENNQNLPLIYELSFVNSLDKDGGMLDAGHLTRRTDNRWTTKLTFWQPRGHTRNKGRPKFRWRDDLDKFRKHWHRDASDRLRWRQMGKAYVQLRNFKGWPDPDPDPAVLIYMYMYVFLGSMYVCNPMYVHACISVHVGIRIIYVFTTVFSIWQ